MRALGTSSRAADIALLRESWLPLRQPPLQLAHYILLQDLRRRLLFLSDHGRGVAQIAGQGKAEAFVDRQSTEPRAAGLALARLPPAFEYTLMPGAHLGDERAG